MSARQQKICSLLTHDMPALNSRNYLLILMLFFVFVFRLVAGESVG